MATVLDALLVTFGLDSSGIKKGADEGKTAFESLKSTALKTLATIGAAALLKSAFGNYLKAADSVAKLSAALGENASDLQAWGGAVVLNGGSVESFNGSIKNLNEGLVQMATTGGGRAAKFFNQLGISATDTAGKVRPANDVLLDLADRFQKLTAQEAAGLGAKIGLDQGTITMLKQGRDGVAAMVKEQKELGEYTKRDTDAAEAFNDSWDKTAKALSMVASKVFTLFTPALTGIMDAIRPVITQVRVWIEILSKKLEPAIDAVTKFMKEHKTVVTAAFIAIAGIILAIYLPAIISAGIATLVAMAPFLLIAAIFAIVGLAIGVLVEDIMAWKNGGTSAFGDVYQAVADFWAKVKPVIDAFIDFIMAIWNLYWAAVQVIFDKLVKAWKFVFDLFKEPVTEFFSWVTGKFDGLEDLVNKVKGWFGKATDEVKSLTAKLESEVSVVNPGDAISPAVAAAGAGGGNKSLTATQSIGTINIHSAAKDAAGIGKDIAGATSSGYQNMVMATDSGVSQ